MELGNIQLKDKTTKILKKAKNKAKSVLSTPPQKSKTYYDLNADTVKSFSVLQKEFANFLGANHQRKKLEKNLKKAVHGYGNKNNGRLSQREKKGKEAVETFNKAVEKIRKKKLAEIDRKAQTTIGQDIKKTTKKTKNKISKSIEKANTAFWKLHGDDIAPTVVNKENAKKTAKKYIVEPTKNFYENTDEVVTKAGRAVGKGLGKTAKFIKNEPAMAAGKLVVGPLGKAAAFAISPAVGTAVVASPIGPGTAAGAVGAGVQRLVTPYNKVVPITKTVKKQREKVDMWGKPTGKMETYRDKEVVGYGTLRTKKAIEGKRLEDSFTNALTPKFKKHWSIKKGVQSVKAGTEKVGQLFRPRRGVLVPA